jgi:outer membrane biogenesis lipoprotein LolB
MAALAVALAALSGCAGIPTSPSGGATSQSGALAAEFSIAGRFSARNGTEQVSGQFRYSQNGGSRTLNLFSPLGTPLADIVANGEVATLTQANGATQSAESLSGLLRSVIDLPVTDVTLAAWLQGQPSSTDAARTTGIARNEAGMPTVFVESGWEILISERMQASDSASGVAIAPKRMRWTLVGQPETEVRWVIDQWRTP